MYTERDKTGTEKNLMENTRPWIVSDHRNPVYRFRHLAFSFSAAGLASRFKATHQCTSEDSRIAVKAENTTNVTSIVQTHNNFDFP